MILFHVLFVKIKRGQLEAVASLWLVTNILRHPAADILFFFL